MLIKLALLLIMAAVMFLLAGCGGGEAPPESAPPEEPAEAQEAPAAPEPEPEPEPEAKAEPEPAPPAEPAGPPRVRMETDKGTLVLELYPDRAPETVANFLQYVDDGFYDGTIFHRVIPKFMIQGGGFVPGMQEKPTRPPIKNESGSMANTKYTVAMARTPNPHSASAQFFINHQTNQFLDKENARDGWGYCVFGKVVEGIDVVEAIAQVATGSKMGHQDVPLTPVVIKSAQRAG